MDPAELVPLGRTGLRVSRLGLGLASIGGLFAAVPEDQALATIDQAWDLGVRLFDTAPVYGYGLSERRTGLALRFRPRDELVLCTKVGRLIEPGGPDTQPIWADPPPGVGPRLDYSYDGVLRSVQDSLARLGLDRVDVLHIHDPDQDFGRAATEAFRALTDLRDQGTVAAVSLGVNHADVAARFLREAEPDCILLAGRYTLLDQSGAEDLLPLCAERGVAVLAAGLFGGGVLADPAPGAPHGYRDVPSTLTARIEAIREICRRYDVPPLAAAVQFPFRHPAVAAAVLGARSPAEITGTAALLDHPIPDSLWRDLAEAGLTPPSTAA